MYEDKNLSITRICNIYAVTNAKSMNKEYQWRCPIDPNDIPKEYNYIAQDKDGEWYAYRNKPELDYELYCWVADETPLFLTKGDYNKNWENTLQQIRDEANK